MSAGSGSQRGSTAIAPLTQAKTSSSQQPRALRPKVTVQSEPSTARQLPSNNDGDDPQINLRLTNDLQNDESLIITKIKPLVGITDTKLKPKYDLKNRPSIKTVTNCKTKRSKSDLSKDKKKNNNELKEISQESLNELNSEEKSFNRNDGNVCHELEHGNKTTSKKLADEETVSDVPLNGSNASSSSVLYNEFSLPSQSQIPCGQTTCRTPLYSESQLTTSSFSQKTCQDLELPPLVSSFQTGYTAKVKSDEELVDIEPNNDCDEPPLHSLEPSEANVVVSKISLSRETSETPFPDYNMNPSPCIIPGTSQDTSDNLMSVHTSPVISKDTGNNKRNSQELSAFSESYKEFCKKRSGDLLSKQSPTKIFNAHMSDKDQLTPESESDHDQNNATLSTMNSYKQPSDGTADMEHLTETDVVPASSDDCSNFEEKYYRRCRSMDIPSNQIESVIIQQNVNNSVTPPNELVDEVNISYGKSSEVSLNNNENYSVSSAKKSPQKRKSSSLDENNSGNDKKKPLNVSSVSYVCESNHPSNVSHEAGKGSQKIDIHSTKTKKKSKKSMEKRRSIENISDCKSAANNSKEGPSGATKKNIDDASVAPSNSTAVTINSSDTCKSDFFKCAVRKTKKRLSHSLDSEEILLSLSREKMKKSSKRKRRSESNFQESVDDSEITVVSPIICKKSKVQQEIDVKHKVQKSASKSSKVNDIRNYFDLNSTTSENKKGIEGKKAPNEQDCVPSTSINLTKADERIINSLNVKKGKSSKKKKIDQMEIVSPICSNVAKRKKKKAKISNKITSHEDSHSLMIEIKDFFNL